MDLGCCTPWQGHAHVSNAHSLRASSMFPTTRFFKLFGAKDQTYKRIVRHTQVSAPELDEVIRGVIRVC